MKYTAKQQMMIDDGFPASLFRTVEERKAWWAMYQPKALKPWVDPRIEADQALRDQQKREATKIRIQKLVVSQQHKVALKQATPNKVDRRNMTWDARRARWVPINPQGKTMITDDELHQSQADTATPETAEPKAGKTEEATVAKKSKTKSKKSTVKKSAAKKSTKPKAAKKEGARAGSKTEMVAKLLQRASGCTTEDVLNATGWKVVGMVQQAKVCGLKIRKEKEKGKPTRYFAV